MLGGDTEKVAREQVKERILAGWRAILPYPRETAFPQYWPFSASPRRRPVNQKNAEFVRRRRCTRGRDGSKKNEWNRVRDARACPQRRQVLAPPHLPGTPRATRERPHGRGSIRRCATTPPRRRGLRAGGLGHGESAHAGTVPSLRLPRSESSV